MSGEPNCLVDFKIGSTCCFVVSACKKYVPELCALLNSLDFVGYMHDVHVIGYDLPEVLTSQFDKLRYKVIHHPISEEEARYFGGESEILCRKRYWYAAKIGRKYCSTCILDADMVIVRPIDKYFRIANATSLLLGATLEQKRMYASIEHHKVYGKQVLPEPVWNKNDICCAPIFAAMDQGWHHVFEVSWEYYANAGFKAPDMEAINLAILEANRTNMVMLLSNVQWVGTNEKLLKPYIRAIRQEKDPAPGGKIWTETGDPVYIIHGQFYKARWRKQQLLNRKGCIDGYIGGSEKCENMAAGALEMLTRYFFHCLDYKIKVPHKAYTNNGHPELIEDDKNVV